MRRSLSGVWVTIDICLSAVTHVGIVTGDNRRRLMGNETSHFRDDGADFSRKLRQGMRATAMCVSILTTRDRQGHCFGQAVANPVQFSASFPSVMVAVDRLSSPCAAISMSGLFCLNHISSRDIDCLDRFVRSDCLAGQHGREPWSVGLYGLPYLETAATTYFCRVIGAHDYGDKTIFIGKIEGVRLDEDMDAAHGDPLIWMNGGPVRLAGREML